MEIQLSGVQTELGSKGVNFQVWDNNGKHLGHLVVGKGKVKWYTGKEQTGHELNWDKFIELMEAHGKKK